MIGVVESAGRVGLRDDSVEETVYVKTVDIFVPLIVLQLEEIESEEIVRFLLGGTRCDRFREHEIERILDVLGGREDLRGRDFSVILWCVGKLKGGFDGELIYGRLIRFFNFVF